MRYVAWKSAYRKVLNTHATHDFCKECSLPHIGTIFLWKPGHNKISLKNLITDTKLFTVGPVSSGQHKIKRQHHNST